MTKNGVVRLVEEFCFGFELWKIPQNIFQFGFENSFRMAY